MGTSLLRLCCSLGVVVLLGALAEVRAAPAPEKKKRDAEDIARAEKAVQDELARLRGEGAAVAYVKDPDAVRLFPDGSFFSVMFRRFPVGRVPPEGLQPANLFVVDGTGKVKVLPDSKSLVKYALDHAGRAKSGDQIKETVRGYLQLCQHLHQDGYFAFSVMEDSLQVKRNDGGATAVGSLVCMRGGSGTIKATLEFGGDGKLTGIKEQAQLRPGPRPRCQATKLLDRDPVVRQMAEQDLLIMGPAARHYLDEQRAKAGPELQKAIDRIWQRILDSER
jgi:hypothetical protein